MYTQFYGAKLLQEVRWGFGEEGRATLMVMDWPRGTSAPLLAREFSSVEAANW